MFKKALLAVAATAASTAAMAHVSVESPKSVSAGQTVNIVVQVPHGCDGQTTKGVTVDLPNGFLDAKPQPKAGWKVSTKTDKYDKTYKLWGDDVKEGVKQVTWSGGSLPNDQYDTFLIHGVVANELHHEDADKLFFPVTQACEKMTVKWTDTSGKMMHGHEWDKPMTAPSVKLGAGEVSGMDHHHH